MSTVKIYQKRDGEWRVVCDVTVVEGTEIHARYSHVDEYINREWVKRECGRVPLNEQPYYTGIAIAAYMAGIRKVVLS